MLPELPCFRIFSCGKSHAVLQLTLSSSCACDGCITSRVETGRGGREEKRSKFNDDINLPVLSPLLLLLPSSSSFFRQRPRFDTPLGLWKLLLPFICIFLGKTVRSILPCLPCMLGGGEFSTCAFYISSLGRTEEGYFLNSPDCYRRILCTKEGGEGAWLFAAKPHYPLFSLLLLSPSQRHQKTNKKQELSSPSLRK